MQGSGKKIKVNAIVCDSDKANTLLSHVKVCMEDIPKLLTQLKGDSGLDHRFVRLQLPAVSNIEFLRQVIHGYTMYLKLFHEPDSNQVVVFSANPDAVEKLILLCGLLHVNLLEMRDLTAASQKKGDIIQLMLNCTISTKMLSILQCLYPLSSIEGEYVRINSGQKK